MFTGLTGLVMAKPVRECSSWRRICSCHCHTHTRICYFHQFKKHSKYLFRCNSHWLKTYPKVCMLLRLEGTYVGWNQQYCLRNITNFNNTFLQILRVLFHHRCSPVFKDFELHVILLFLQEVAQEIEKVCDPLKAKSAILFATDQSASIQDVRRKTDKSKTVKG